MISVSYKVNFFDTDAMSVVHHSNYIRWFEIGRVEFLRSLGITLSDLMEAGYVFPITEARALYHAPAVFDDVLRIEVFPVALTRAKMAFDYRVTREADGLLLVTGHTQNVFTSRESGRVARLSERFYAPLEAAMKEEGKV